MRIAGHLVPGKNGYFFLTDPHPMSEANKTTSLARKAGIFTISRAVSILAQLVAMMVLSRSLPKEVYAQLQYLLLIYATAQVVGQLGLPDSIFYFFEKYPPEKRRSLARYISRMLMYTALGSAVILFAIGWWGTADAAYTDARPVLWMFMALVVLELPTVPVPNVLIALNKANKAAGFNIFVGLTQFAAMTLPLLTDQPLRWIAVGLLAYGLLRMLVSALLLRQNFAGQPLLPLPEKFLQELLWYAVPLSLAQLFWTLNRQVDKYVVKEFLSAQQYAEYSNGAWELPLIPTIAYSVAAVMMPQMVSYFLKGDVKSLLELWLKSIKKVSVIVLPLVVFFLLSSEEFIVMLFSEKYRSSALPFFIYTFILLQRVASYSNMQKALDVTREVTLGAIYLFAINALLVVPFVLLWGMAGPPLASVIAQTFAWWYALNVIRKRLGVTFFEVFPFGYYGKTLLLAFVAATPLYLLKQHWTLSPAMAFGTMALCFFPLFFLLGRIFNVITAQDVNRLLRR